MSTSNKTNEKDESVLGESEDDFQYEEVSLTEDWSLTEGEEDLEATVKAIQNQAEAGAHSLRPNATSITHQPQAVEDFLRNFLLQMCMTETLDCFQTEWTEMAQRALVDTEWASVLPDVHAENQRLDRELKNAQREGEEYSLAASAGAETLARVQKERDFHRLQHKRVVQEKNKVIEEIRKFKSKCDQYEPVLKRMKEKYQALLKKTTLMTLQRDKALVQVNSQTALQNTPLCGDAGEEGAENRAGELSVEETTRPVIQPRPPPSAQSP